MISVYFKSLNMMLLSSVVLAFMRDHEPQLVYAGEFYLKSSKNVV